MSTNGLLSQNYNGRQKPGPIFIIQFRLAMRWPGGGVEHVFIHILLCKLWTLYFNTTQYISWRSSIFFCEALKKKPVGQAWIKIIMTYLDINTDNVHRDCQNTNNGWLVDNAHTTVHSLYLILTYFFFLLLLTSLPAKTILISKIY